MKDERIFAERLKELRTEQGLSYKKLSDKVGISPSQLNRWETCKSDITSDNLLILCNYFRVSADYLIGLKDSE